MARTFKIVLAIMAAAFLWAGIKSQLIPQWRDLPREDSFSLSLLLENTDYSETFSESKFSKIAPGMNKAEILALVGEPIRITTSWKGRIVALRDYRKGAWSVRYIDLPSSYGTRIDAETYFYSRQASPTANWYIRAVTFSRNGTVIEVTRAFYID
jgi:hypothetical protein